MSRVLFLCCVALFIGGSGVVAQTPARPAPAAIEGYTPPKVIKRAPVPYPEVAHLNRVEGVVKIKFTIDDAGHVADAVVIGSSNSIILDDVVRERGIREWTFQPATLNGKPVPSTFEQEFEFRLDPAEQRAIALKRLAAPIAIAEPPYPPEALARKLAGQTTIGVHWTTGDHAGLVDDIYLIKSSGSGLLDVAALRFAYENWRIDPGKVTKEAFVKTIDFRPPQ